MTQYLRPKILGTVPTSLKNTDLNYEYFMTGDINLNPETCKPYDNREKFSRNTVDNYGNGVTHNRTKEYDLYSIYSKKFIEEICTKRACVYKVNPKSILNIPTINLDELLK